MVISTILCLSEILLGPNRYASSVFTLSLVALPIKIAFALSGRRFRGPVLILSGLVTLYLRIVPTSRSDSIHILPFCNMSYKIFLPVLILILTYLGGLPSFIEMIVGISASFFVCPSRNRADPHFHLSKIFPPSILVRLSLSFAKTAGKWLTS